MEKVWDKSAPKREFRVASAGFCDLLYKADDQKLNTETTRTTNTAAAVCVCEGIWHRFLWKFPMLQEQTLPFSLSRTTSRLTGWVELCREEDEKLELQNRDSESSLPTDSSVTFHVQVFLLLTQM